MTTATAPPDLWLDWCAVTGTPATSRDEGTLTLFARQAGPSRRVLAALRPHAENDAPVWPAERREDTASLARLVHRGTALIDDPITDWVTRLRLRRLLFAGVLLAPAWQGGLGLTRGQIRDLRPARLARLRGAIGVAEDEVRCPACAVWSWLEVVGTNNGWSHASVRELGHRRDDHDPARHRHDRDDSSTDWHDCPALLPAIDRWGWIDQRNPMHPSSMSALVPAIETLIETRAPETPAVEPVLSRSIRTVTPEEEAAILARADELNARMRQILAEYG